MLFEWRTTLLVLFVTLLTLQYVGVWLCIVFSTLGIVFLTGVALAINHDTVMREKNKQNMLFRLRSPENEKHVFTKGLTQIDTALQGRINAKQFEYQLLSQRSRELTHVKQLDDVINKMIDLCMVYFIRGWYSKLNHDQAFLIKTRLLIEQCVITGSEKVMSADWYMFLTKRILQEVVTHIRIYKTAHQQTLAQSLRRQGKKGDPMKVLSIEDWFFRVEQEQTDDSFQVNKQIFLQINYNMLLS